MHAVGRVEDAARQRCVLHEENLRLRREARAMARQNTAAEAALRCLTGHGTMRRSGRVTTDQLERQMAELRRELRAASDTIEGLLDGLLG